MLHPVVTYVTTGSYFIVAMFDSGVLDLTRGETSVPLLRPPRTMNTVEFWGRLHFLLKKTGGERFINELNYSLRAFRRERDASITLMLLFQEWSPYTA
jgi:hypothetical protein